MPWLDAPTALLPLWMFHTDGRPYEGDPRQALARVVERYTQAGLTPVVATELEFFLIDDSGRHLRVPPSPRSGKRRTGGEVLSLRALDAFDQFFTTLYDACESMDIPADTAISEAGPGQFEINLMHQTDPLKAADGQRRVAQHVLSIVDGHALRTGPQHRAQPRRGPDPRVEAGRHGSAARPVGPLYVCPVHAFAGVPTSILLQSLEYDR